MMSIGFTQLINEPTCDTGSIIDHVYVNEAMQAQSISTEIDPVHFSDHDIISLYIEKKE